MAVSEVTDLTLVDYFAVIGLDKNSGLKLDPSLEVLAELSGTSGANEKLPPLERTYEAKILAHFPEKRRGHPFLYEIFSLCMPKGLKFYTEKNVPMVPHFHSFVVIKEDGSRVNGCALTIYEEVKDEAIRQAMFDLQMEHVKEISAATSNEKTSPNINYDSRIRQQPGTVSFGNHTMPRHISAKRNRAKRISYYDNISKPIFVAKCLCVLTRIPMVFTPEKILRTVADIISKNHAILPIPLESFIYWILHEVPLPLRGTSLQLNYSGVDLIVIRPQLYDLPYFDYPLQQMFSYISIEKFLKLFTCFMLEHQILLCSKHMDRLMLIAESLSTLVFPFRWQLTYVPILPYSQLKFIEAPVPYLMGLCYDDFIPDQIYQSNVCILDIDTGKLDHPEDVPQFPKHRQVTDEIHRIITHCQETFAKQKKQQQSQNFEATINSEIPKVVMRKKSGNKRDDLWSMKRMSRSFDNHESLKASEDVYRHQREQEVAAAAMVMNEDLDNRNNSPARMDDDGYETASQSPVSAETQIYFQGLRLNHAVRDLLLNHFACLFYSYESFVINEHTSQQPRDSVVNFDKASFLSDQPDSFLPFLAAFLETQMFASFIDSKILSHLQSDFDENVVIFDTKIKQVREKLASAKAQTPTVEKPADIMINEDSEILTPTFPPTQMDYEVRQPHSLAGTAIRNYGGFFPEIDRRLFETNTISSSTHSPWKQQKQRQRNNSLLDDSSVNNTPKHTPKKRIGDDSTRSQAHWKFVEQLLKETKTKTKRMLVMKMGKEAVHLGHNDLGITGVEENTLVAGFCDLLERVWAHGLKKKHGKSALWTHVLSHQEREKYPHSARSIEQSTNLTPEFLPVPKAEIEAFEKAVDSNAETTFRNSGGLNELIESLRQLSKPLEPSSSSNDPTTSAASTIDDTSWSNSFLKAANFIADKLAQPDEDEAAATENAISLANNNDEGSYRNPRARREPGRPLPRSSSVTRFASWASNRIREATSTVATAAPNPPPPPLPPSRDINGNSAAAAATATTSDAVLLPPSGNSMHSRTSRVSDISRPPIIKRGMHKSSSVSDFAPHWSHDSSSSVPSSSASSVVNSPAYPPSTRSSSSTRTKGHERKRSLSRPRSPVDHIKNLSPLPTHIAYDLKSVMEMSEIKTDIGCARAFVRLSLERKLLHKHLKTIFSNEHLLQKLYKRYAFLRSEEEREQFLFHILSLNAVDFSCFTHTFIATKMQYEVMVVAGIDRFASSTIWIMITGSLGNTSVINLPVNSLQFTFDHKNLGVLSTLRIGHNLNQKSSKPSKWFLDYIIVRNNITGQTFRFNCGRMFGRAVDDGALERLLVAEVLPRESPNCDGTSSSSSSTTHHQQRHQHQPSSSSSIFGGLISRPESPISGIFTGGNSLASQKAQSVFHYSTQSLARRRRSPSVQRTSDVDGINPRISELHHQLGVAVNALMKHFLADQNYGGGGSLLTPLLCGENGLVSVLEKVFSLGRKEGLYSLFQKQYPWDYVESVFNWFFNFFRHGESNRISKDQRSLIIFAGQLVRKIKDNNAVGKEGKFHVFILLTLKDHILASVLPLMVWTPLTQQLYHDDAFIRQQSHTSYLSKLLASLNEFNFTLEKSLTYGIDM